MCSELQVRQELSAPVMTPVAPAARLRPFPALLLAAAPLILARPGRAFPQGQRCPPKAVVSPRPVLLTVRGVNIYNGGFGSGLVPHGSRPGFFYMLTDRGPNFTPSNPDQKVFPVPSFAPQIGLFRLKDCLLERVDVVELKNAAGTRLSGIPNPPGAGGTGEIPVELDGRILPFDPEGLDPEGLAVLHDGTFWVSDEYGPNLVHLDAGGRTIERINPFSAGRVLPLVLAKRPPNRGMEGLTVTPDQSTLVGLMQSAVNNPGATAATSLAARIVTYDTRTGGTQQFVYLLEAPGFFTSDIAAITDYSFLVIEHDAKFPGDSIGPSRLQRIYRIDIGGATDVSDPANTPAGRLFHGKTLEEMSPEELLAEGVVPVTKTLVFDLLASGLGYPHNKPEGIAVIDEFTIAIANDDDFGIARDPNGRLQTKVAPLLRQQDVSEVYFIHLPTRLE